MADGGPGPQPGLPAEISNSLAIVWKRYLGRRPTDVETSVDGTRISCVLKGSVSGFEAAISAPEVDLEGAPLEPRTVAGYRREAIEAVRKATGRRVMAFVSDHDTRSDVATEVFILDTPPRRRRAILLEASENGRPEMRGA
jgi:uncharacterized protein YbcI